MNLKSKKIEDKKGKTNKAKLEAVGYVKRLYKV